ncbi:uncharacterized protein EI97DRAFT_97029 [Westerdykella ornata]|uniref:Uncharacterized protein n=1 Tax=Westerdykella ornata TaxID=318751 RepID=A0A6A6JEU1_WESOR|nr:uncharacterized protein EI97DRAFT_97029 [Westerdykella ornata]KAF2274693.1 hypothetical protein EI97DRAFT_97029 [Westerdykella ornata]
MLRRAQSHSLTYSREFVNGNMPACSTLSYFSQTYPPSPVPIRISHLPLPSRVQPSQHTVNQPLVRLNHLPALREEKPTPTVRCSSKEKANSESKPFALCKERWESYKRHSRRRAQG